jgi:hypothetical protein
LCRQSFERALAIDPAFELAQVERGHPIWGKQFQAARAAQSRSSSSGNASSVNTNAPQPLSAPAKTGPTSAGGSADPRKP